MVSSAVLHSQLQNINSMSVVKKWHKIQFSTVEQPQASGQSEHEIVTCLYMVTRYLFSSECSDTSDRLCGLVVRVSGHSSRGPGFDPRPYHIFSEVGGLERGPPSLMRTIEELRSCSSLEPRDKRPWEFVALTTQHPLPAKLAKALPTSGGCSVSRVRLRIKATEFSFFF
jgi:hypothetical protein